MQHQEFGEILLKRFIERLEDVSKVDQPLRSEGRTMAVTLAPDKDKIKRLQQPAKGSKNENLVDAKSETASQDGASASPE